ncbi:hypothetical protein ACFOET_11180 [Parapedobacter deserti]|uniref:Bacterial repeat domain-containing protein n=1 Tax=Parapedobacter deserti TaxID=1912957 RepID=A0ABV7JPB6_9SPHI
MRTKYIYVSCICLLLVMVGRIQAQTETTLHQNYKAITIPMDQNVPYSRSLILLHEIYNGANPLANNYVIGTIAALRGATTSIHRADIVHINSGSAYTMTRASLGSYNISVSWRLKTCIYDSKHYMALEVPYATAQHSQGYHFVGWVSSSGENLKTVTYNVNGVPQNQHLLSNVQDFEPNMTAEQQVSRFVVTGNVGIGIHNPTEKLSVNGNIRAKEVKVEMANWPDYVFKEDYDLMPLAELESYINTHGHLPGIPTAKQVEADGVALAEMNRKLLEKVEELTLHLIEKKRVELVQDERIERLEMEVYKSKSNEMGETD